MFVKAILKNNRGVALLLAVTVVSLLIAATVQFSKEMRQELMSSANSLSINTLGIMVKSGYNLAAAVLLAEDDDNQADTLQESWALLENQEMSQLYPRTILSVAIEDLGGRIPLNSLLGSSDGGDDVAAQRTGEVLKRLLLSEDVVEVTEERADLIIAAIANWVDKDDEEDGLESTESSFYRGLQPSYASKNKPMEFVEELLLIRGITRELYYGDRDHLGLRDLVTVHGTEGTININTAPKAVLKALSSAMSDDLADQLIAFREDEKNRDQLGNSMWYTNVLPGDVVIENGLLVTGSSFYRITARAENNGIEKTLSATVQKQTDKTLTTLNRRLE